MQPIKLKEVDVEAIDTLSNLARLTWHQHYLSIIGQDQIDYMLKKMYSRESLVDQIQNQKHRFFLIEREKTPIGFISVYPENKQDWFLSKFYIDQNHAGKGYGEMVFHNIVQITQAKKIRLTVNRQNFKSVNFYFKLGFRIERVADFNIGEGYEMNDFVMLWKLKE